MMLHVIIVAGGQGLRMGKEVPKQFLMLEGKPILYYTIKRFLDFSANCQIVIVLPAESMATNNIVQDYFPANSNIQTVAGGATRFHSVLNGLNAMDGEGIVMIHDGVRPFVSKAVLESCYECAVKNGNAVPVVDLKESIRMLGLHNNQSANRASFKAIQTPQTFQLSEIKKAYKADFDESFTDDASVFERSGGQIFLVQGNEDNIKITTPLDLVLATHLLSLDL